jgi:phage terminase small subunit
MPILSNVRREKFCQAIMAGENAEQAYITAGYKANRGNAGTLRAKKDIVRRLEELMSRRSAAEIVSTARAIEQTGITKAKVAEELSKIGFANMKDYMRVGPHGDPVLDFSAITRDQAAALIEVTVDDYVDGRGEDARDVRKVKFKLADKRAALMDIAKLFGWIIDKQEFREVDEFESMEERQLRQLVAERARAVAVRDDEADETGTRH